LDSVLLRYQQKGEKGVFCPKIDWTRKMLRIHLFSIFTNKMPLNLAVLTPFGILIVKKLKNVLFLNVAS